MHNGKTPSRPICPSCAKPFAGGFCSHCGERAFAQEELTIRAQLGQLAGGLFNLDGRFLRSFFLLVAKPGYLALEYCRGARVRTMRPVQIFLVANLFYFLLQPYFPTNTFRSTLDLQTSNQFYSAHLERVVSDHLAQSSEERSAYRERFDSRAESLSRSLIFVMIPAYALVLSLLSMRGKRGFVEQLVLATHFVAFQIAFLLLPLAALLAAMRVSEFQASALVMGLAAPWWFLALRRFEVAEPAMAAVKAVVLCAATLPIVVGYRYMVFWLTFSIA